GEEEGSEGADRARRRGWLDRLHATDDGPAAGDRGGPGSSLGRCTWSVARAALFAVWPPRSSRRRADPASGRRLDWPSRRLTSALARLIVGARTFRLIRQPDSGKGVASDGLQVVPHGSGSRVQALDEGRGVSGQGLGATV